MNLQTRVKQSLPRPVFALPQEAFTGLERAAARGHGAEHIRGLMATSASAAEEGPARPAGERRRPRRPDLRAGTEATGIRRKARSIPRHQIRAWSSTRSRPRGLLYAALGRIEAGRPPPRCYRACTPPTPRRRRGKERDARLGRRGSRPRASASATRRGPAQGGSVGRRGARE